MPEITMEIVEQVFRPEKASEAALGHMKLVEDAFVEMAKVVLANVPRCAHRSAALRDLLTAKWACIDAIVKGGLV